MHKVYLILRNNNQEGPFTLEELLQHGLKPTDLIWEEGRSAGWSYPADIGSLRPFVQKNDPLQEQPNTPIQKPQDKDHSSSDLDAPFASKKATSKNVYVSLPGKDDHREEKTHTTIEESLEQKADAIRKRAFEAAKHKTDAPTYQPLQPDYELETRVARSTGELGEDYSAWLYTRQVAKKKKAQRAKALVALSAVIFFAAALGYIFLKSDRAGSKVEPAGSVQQQDHDANSIVEKENVQSGYANEATISEPVLDTIQDVRPHADTNSVFTRKKPVKPHLAAKKAAEPAKNEAVTAVEEVIPEQDVATDTVIEEKDVAIKEPVLPEKKETLAQKIGNLFGKRKNKDKTEPSSNGQASTGPPSSGQGIPPTANKPAPPINLANSVTITANTAYTSNENWMMGVHGLKLTLYNKSKETLKTATVEVLYYNDQKDLLEKKVVTFNNVLPKRSQTVLAPDHRLADHADYQLISAIAKEDAYVKQ